MAPHGMNANHDFKLDLKSPTLLFPWCRLSVRVVSVMLLKGTRASVCNWIYLLFETLFNHCPVLNKSICNCVNRHDHFMI